MNGQTWNHAYRELWREAATRRGFVDATSPLGDASAIRRWPRTRNADVLAIAAVMDSTLRTLPLEAGGYAVARRWQRCTSDLARFALGDASREYACNRAFWSTLASTIAYLASIEAPVPPMWRALVAGLAHREHRNVTYAGEGTFEQMWDKQRADLAEARGSDLRDAPPGMVGRPMNIPRTTNADILKLGPYWTAAWKKLEARRGWLGNLPTEQGLDGQHARWDALLRDIDTIAKPGKPDDTYLKNHEFWRETHGLAETLDLFHELPTSFDIALGVAKELPTRLGHVIGEVARGIGDTAKEAGEGLLSSLGKPLLIGGGLVLGLVLLLRGGSHAE